MLEGGAWAAARDEEMRIPWKGMSEGQPPTEEQYQERFWRRRLDGIALDVVTKEFLTIELKRTQDMRSNHVDEITAVAQQQYKSPLMGLQAIGQNKGWKVQQFVFVGGTCDPTRTCDSGDDFTSHSSHSTHSPASTPVHPLSHCRFPHSPHSAQFSLFR